MGFEFKMPENPLDTAKKAIKSGTDSLKELADKANDKVAKGVGRLANEMGVFRDINQKIKFVQAKPGDGAVTKDASEASRASGDPSILQKHLRTLKVTREVEKENPDDASGVMKDVRAYEVSEDDQKIILKDIREIHSDAFNYNPSTQSLDDAAQTYKLAVEKLDKAGEELSKQLYEADGSPKKFPSSIPPFVPSLKWKDKFAVYSANQDLYEKSFPGDSIIDNEKRLDTLIGKELGSMDFGNSISFDYSSISRKGPRCILNNPNLSGTQVDKLAQKFIDKSSFVGNTNNPDYFSNAEKTYKIWSKISNHLSCQESTLSKLSKRFGKLFPNGKPPKQT